MTKIDDYINKIAVQIIIDFNVKIQNYYIDNCKTSYFCFQIE